MSQASDKIKSKLNAIKNSVDSEKNKANDLYNKTQNKINSVTDNLNKDLKIANKDGSKKIDDFKKKLQSKIDNKKDIFEDMLDTCQVFLNDKTGKIKTKFDKRNPIDHKKKFETNSKIKQYAYESMVITLLASKEIISNNVKKVFFSGEGVCGSNANLKTDVISISPKEIDFLNILTLSPDTGIGKIIYESDDNSNLVKMNKSLYNTFNGPQFSFNSVSNKQLFNVLWDEGNQQFYVNGLLKNGTDINVGTFFNDYYDSIEFPDISNVLKVNMFLTINGDGTENINFTKSFNDLNRLLQKIFSICGPKKNREQIKNQKTNDLFDENDGDLDYYFDFENLEGVNLDDEESRLRKVLKFTDCNNFEIPTEPTMMEDFIFQATKKNINDLIDSTLSMTAQNAYEQSDSSIPKNNFHLSLDTSFILNLPKALIANVLSPKIFFPIVLIYKMFKTTTQNVITNAKEIMIKLKKLFLYIIKDIFWKFLSEFWKKIKTELIKFLKTLSLSIIKERYDRYVTMLKSLIALIRNLLNTKINTCENLFGTIGNVIDTSLNVNVTGAKVPGFLVGFSDKLSGFSKKRALINIIENLESNGISTQDINGVVPNNLIVYTKSFLDGMFNELDKNSFISTSNKEIILPSPIGPIVIPPGIINSAGKLF